MIELDDCGRELHLALDKIGEHKGYSWRVDVNVQMVIKAPRGTLTLFDRCYMSPDTQCEGIRAFMKEHKND